MKNIYLTLVIAICFLFSCNKEENNRITEDYVYELDSVGLSSIIYDGINSYHNHITIPIYNKLSDSLLELLYIPSINDSIFIKGDSILFRSINNRNCQIGNFFYISSSSNLLIYNKKIIYHSTYERDGHCLNDKYWSNYMSLSYLNNNLLDSINIDNREVFNINLKNVITSKCKFRYSNNMLLGFTKKDIFYIENNLLFDTMSSILNTYNFEYSNNLLNQNRLIGIDLNDIILNHLISSLHDPNFYMGSLLGFHRFHNTIFILNKISTFSTNSNKLIENIEFNKVFTSDRVNISAQYTFDSTKNNRVNSIEISEFNTTIGFPRKYLYTFYYKN